MSDYIKQNFQNNMILEAKHLNHIENGIENVFSDLRDVINYNNLTASVKAFGAVGNGTHDDTAAFQAAADSGIVNIYVPQSKGERYLIKKTIEVGEVRGQKWFSEPTGGWDYGITKGGIYGYNLDILFRVKGQKAFQVSFSHLNLKNTNMADDKGNSLSHKGTAILIDSTSVQDNNDSVIQNCCVDYFSTAAELHGRGFTIKDCFFGGTSVGIKSYYSFDGTGTDNIWQKPEFGYRGITIQGNKFHTNTDTCICFYGDNVFNIAIQNNIFDGGGLGCFIDFRQSVKGALITGNRILSPRALRVGCNILNGQTEVPSAKVDGLLFSNNDVGLPSDSIYNFYKYNPNTANNPTNYPSPSIRFGKQTSVTNSSFNNNIFKYCPSCIVQIEKCPANDNTTYHSGLSFCSNIIENCNTNLGKEAANPSSQVLGVFMISKNSNNFLINNNIVNNDYDILITLLRSYGGLMEPKNSFVQNNALSSNVRVAHNVGVKEENNCLIQPDPVY